MTVNVHWVSVTCALFALCLLLCVVQGEKIFIEAGKPLKTVIPSRGQSSFTVVNISSAYSHITFQAHTQHDFISISSSQTFPNDFTLNGSHVGIVTLLKQGESEGTVYVKSELNSSLDVLIYAELYTPKDPLPGGCNQVFKLENDPNIHLSFHSQWTLVEFQWSNLGFPRGGRPPACEIEQIQSRLRYDLYVFYLSDQTEETFLSDVPKMLSGKNVMKNGRKVTSIINSGATKSLGRVPSVKGRGVMYAIVVTDTKNNTMASYIPVQTYSCRLGDKDCVQKLSAVDVTIAVISGILGLFLCCMGHRYLKTEFFVFGFLGFSLVFYIILMKTTDLYVEASFGVSFVVGLVGGTLFLMLWYYWGVPVISVLLVGLTAGYLVSSVIFYTPFGNLSYWASVSTYGLTFTCGVLIVPVFLLYFTRNLNILACTFVGSYLVVLCVDIFMWSSLKFIVLNSVYKQSMQDYLTATVIFPFGIKEAILTAVWGLLFILGSVFQFWRERKRAPFPPCPAHVRKGRTLERPLSRSSDNEERRPLLRDGSRPVYTEGQGQLPPNYQRYRQRGEIPTAPVETNEPT